MAWELRLHASVAVIHNVLVALDDRDASMRAVEYVGAFLAGRNDLKFIYFTR
jgi:hypothetical protein